MDIFCSAQTLDQNGSVRTFGGHYGGENESDTGEPFTTIFDRTTESWTRLTDMPLSVPGAPKSGGRWYPTGLQLGNRRLMVFSGTYKPDGGSAQLNSIPLMIAYGAPGYSGAYMKLLPLQYLTTYYPHVVNDPYYENRLFYSGRAGYTSGNREPGVNKILDLVTLTWSEYKPFSNNSDNVENSYPMATLANMVFVKSGGSPDGTEAIAIKDTWYMDLSVPDSSRAWVKGPDMNVNRKNHVPVVLPTGEVMVFGGNEVGIKPDTQNPLLRTAPERWNPAMPSVGWALMKTSSTDNGGHNRQRGYHNVAMLTQDADVLWGGGEPGDDDSKKSEVFSPPYGNRSDWKDIRPAITSAPSVITYGDNFQVTATFSTSRQVGKIALVPLPSVTHAFNQNNGMLLLNYSVASGVITVTPPDKPHKAPPGFYYLFVVDDYPTSQTDSPGQANGIPSRARIVQLKDYSQVFVTSAQPVTGSFFNAQATKEELYLQDNAYAGNYLYSGTSPTKAEVEIKGDAGTFGARTFRVQVECKPNRAVNMDVYLYKWTTGVYEQVGSTVSLSANVEVFKEFYSADPGISLLPHYYINSDPQSADYGKVKAKLVWQDPNNGSQFQVRIDTAEMGIR